MQIPNSEAFKFISENFAMKEINSSDKELRFTILLVLDLNLAMLDEHTCAIRLSASTLAPVRSSTTFVGYISFKGGKIGGTHV